MLSTSLSLGFAILTCGDYGSIDPATRLAWASVAPDPAVARPAIDGLRAMGPAGLEAFVKAYGSTLNAYATTFDDGGMEATPLQLRVAAAIDGIGGQRDNFVSQLYWHTDFDAARAAAADSGKPILSLHLLGRLDEEYSCANSRFFRTAVYSHADVARTLRENFVLHWETVRPIPEITIDFGDGRTIHRTITGNSCHFVLDAEGRPVDAIPGLYGPQAFIDEINGAAAIHRAIATVDKAARTKYLANWHAGQFSSTRAQWTRDLEAVGAAPPAPLITNAQPAPDAIAAAPRAATKAMVEIPMIARVMPISASLDVLDEATGADTWKLIATLHAHRARLDTGGRRLMRKKSGPETDAMALRFEESMTLDTVRNEYLLHPRIHRWFADAVVRDDHHALSDRVYDELFLTPRSDPWLGLLPENTYAALERDGINQ